MPRAIAVSPMCAFLLAEFVLARRRLLEHSRRTTPWMAFDTPTILVLGGKRMNIFLLWAVVRQAQRQLIVGMPRALELALRKVYQYQPINWWMCELEKLLSRRASGKVVDVGRGNYVLHTAFLKMNDVMHLLEYDDYYIHAAGVQFYKNWISMVNYLSVADTWQDLRANMDPDHVWFDHPNVFVAPG